MEGSRKFQDRVVRSASGRMGWAYVGGLRRSSDRSQGMLDLRCIRIPGATGYSCRGSCPGRARSHCLARRTEKQLTSEREERSYNLAHLILPIVHENLNPQFFLV
jgi:hypothetical protein